MGLFDNLKPKVPENPTPSSQGTPLSPEELRRVATNGAAGNLEQAVADASKSGGDNIAKTSGRRPGQGFRDVRRNSA